MGSPSVARGAATMGRVAAFPWNWWQACDGISGSVRVERVAGLPWNQWQVSPGIGGSFTVEYAVAQVFYDLLLLEDKIDQGKEHFYVMHLDTRSRINMVELVSLGTLTASLVHPRETFRRAVLQGSASIIVAHNHPSGAPRSA